MCLSPREIKCPFKFPSQASICIVKRIKEADFLQYFNQTLYKLDQLDTSGGEYYIEKDVTQDLRDAISTAE